MKLDNTVVESRVTTSVTTHHENGKHKSRVEIRVQFKNSEGGTASVVFNLQLGQSLDAHQLLHESLTLGEELAVLARDGLREKRSGR